MPKWLNAVLTAAASGAVTTIGSVLASGQQTDWKHVGIGGGLGALVGVANLFRQNPATPK